MTKIVKADLGKLIEEVVAYENQRDKKAQCGRSTVQAVNCIVLNDIAHAGVVSHVCTLQAGHSGECECCGYRWMGMAR